MAAVVLADAAIRNAGFSGEALLTRRNAAWAAEINRILVAETGVFLMAVGAAHLAGEDSVQRQLEAPGPVAERVR